MPWLPRIRTSFAYCYFRLGKFALAREQFELIGPHVTGPFLYHGDPVLAATMARRVVGIEPASPTT